QIALADFLSSLTDERVRWEKAPFDHPQLVVPVGAPGDEVSVLADLTVAGQAEDATLNLPATGAAGAARPVQAVLGLPVFAPSPIPAPTPVFSDLAMFATDGISISTRVAAHGDLWSNGDISLGGNGVFQFTGDIVAGGDVSIGGSDATIVDGNIMARGS